MKRKLGHIGINDNNIMGNILLLVHRITCDSDSIAVCVCVCVIGLFVSECERAGLHLIYVQICVTDQRVARGVRSSFIFHFFIYLFYFDV